MRNKFLKIRDEFSDKLYRAYLKESTSCWDFYINSTDENLDIYNKAMDELYELYRDKKVYKNLKNIDEKFLEKHEVKQLKNLIKKFEEELNSGDDLKELRLKESEIAQKYNRYQPKINRKNVTKPEITKILQTEIDKDLREKAYKANIKGADLIAEDLKDLVIKRNNYAKNLGYENYFEYKLKEDYEVDIKELENLLDDVYEKLRDKIKNLLEKEQKELKEIFETRDLKSYHYGFLSDKNPEKDVNKLIKTKEQIVEISKLTYKKMGYDVEKLIKEGKLTLDLFPKKNKNTHGFCFDIDAGCDARILANLTNNIISLETLNHEMGHCVYTLGISRELPFLDRTTYPAMTEAVAMMMQDLQKRENILEKTIPDKILDKYKKTFVEDELKFVSKALTIIKFEHEMYKNPERDLKILWHDMKVKYQIRDKKEKPDNGWAVIPHYLSHPAYYQNYFRAVLIKAQIYNYIVSKLGIMTESKKTAKFLDEKLFKYGTSLEEKEIIEKFTGKKLSADDFIKSLS